MQELMKIVNKVARNQEEQVGRSVMVIIIIDVLLPDIPHSP